MLPKISLKSALDQSTTSNCVTNQITINTGPQTEITEREVKAEYQQQPQFAPPYYQYPECTVPGPELDALLNVNKQLRAENKAHEIIIKMMQENPIYVSQLIIADDVRLAELIKILTDATEVTIDAEVMFTGCWSANEYRRVNAIYIIKDTKTLNLKYDFPEVTKKIKDLGIQTKFVW